MVAKVLPGLALALAVVGTAQASTRAPDLLGRWTTPGGDTVEFGSCAEQVADTSICGRIMALTTGAQRRDIRNPASALRNRPMLGLEIVRGLRESAPGVWTGADLYNPDDGRTYRGAIRLHGRDSLELKGCALVVICQVQTWRRAPT
jgi:uncharacterized protein (DUF2147 family)